MLIRTSAALLIFGAGLTATSAAMSKERCFTRHQQVCTYGQGHGSRLVCTTKASRQCFQVPEVRKQVIKNPIRDGIKVIK